MNSKKTVRLVNMSSAFSSLAIEGSVSDETYAVIDSHINMMHAEILEIKTRTKHQGASTHHDVTNHPAAPKVLN